MVQQQVSLDELKSYLGHIIEEWLSGDIPDEGTEDYAQWDSMRDEIVRRQRLWDRVQPVDGYDLKEGAGNELGMLYVSPYHKRNSEKSPSGLILDVANDQA